ncbi:MAG TPA: ATP-binding cassette domain-containing protein [Vicinamibacterales bacterium]|nr:ATP-binding cassette domain-containing protein [Vicinamibacterales bacterium]
MTAPALELTGVTKSYGALRPLRVAELVLGAGDQIALLGLDQPAAEVLINLVTGASLPDAGEIRIFGRPTTAIENSDEWLMLLDRFGIVSERAALLDSMTVIQNMAVPFSLEIEPPSSETIRQAGTLATEVGLPAPTWEQQVSQLDPISRLRLRLGRALAFNPSVLLLEHPSATLPRSQVVPCGVQLRWIAERRNLAMLTITADAEFAGAVSASAFALEAATGRFTRL